MRLRAVPFQISYNLFCIRGIGCITGYSFPDFIGNIVFLEPAKESFDKLNLLQNPVIFPGNKHYLLFDKQL